MSQQSTTHSALVTGGSGGIGRAIALRLARDGFHVLIHYNCNGDGAEETRAAIALEGGRADAIQFDLRDSKAADEALGAYYKERESLGLGVLVNNAGIHIDSLAGMMSDAAFDDVMKTNAYGAFYLMRWAVKKMIRRREGSIVNIASLAGQLGNAGQINYAASKAAVIAMTKTLAAEVGPRGIRVNAVAPGLIETPMLDGVPGIEAMRERIPLKRFGLPEEVAGVVSFLCSKDAAYVTGHTLSVNGGLFSA